LRIFVLFACLFFSAFGISALAADTQPTLICKASHSAGFEPDNYNGWRPFGGKDITVYKVTATERTGYASYVQTDSGWSFWAAMDETGGPSYIVSDGPSRFQQFTVRKEDLKFQASYSGGYLNGTQTATWMIIGTCRKI